MESFSPFVQAFKHCTSTLQHKLTRYISTLKLSLCDSDNPTVNLPKFKRGDRKINQVAAKHTKISRNIKITEVPKNRFNN